MPGARDLQVHVLPDLAPKEKLRASVAVVVDVLRATTTIVHALAAGCTGVYPVVEVGEAQTLADQMPAGKVLLGGERGGLPVPGFDLGNSPGEYTPQRCNGMALVFTTSNGTRALARAAEAGRVLVAAFVNFSAVCEQLRTEARPVHILCAGAQGEVALEDVMLAGGLVEALSEVEDVKLNDGARLAWDTFENHRRLLLGSLEISQGGVHLQKLGMQDDLQAAAQVDKFALVPELKRDPLRLELAKAGIVRSHWPK